MRFSCLVIVSALFAGACVDGPPTAPTEISPETPPGSASEVTWGTPTPLLWLIGWPKPRNDRFATGFVRQVSHNLDNPAALRRIFSQWLDMIEKEGRRGTWDLDLFANVTYYLAWLILAQLHVPDYAVVFQSELDSYHRVLGANLMSAIDGNLNVCRTERVVEALDNAIFWYELAVQLGLVETYVPLDRTDMVDRIRQNCLTVAVDSVQFPNPGSVGQEFTLRTVSGFRFVGDTASRSGAFLLNIAIDPGGSLLAGYSDNSGLFETAATFSAAGLNRVYSFTCLVLPSRGVETLFACGERLDSAQVVGTPPQPPPPPPPPPGAQIDTFTYSGDEVLTSLNTANRCRDGMFGFYCNYQSVAAWRVLIGKPNLSGVRPVAVIRSFGDFVCNGSVFCYTFDAASDGMSGTYTSGTTTVVFTPAEITIVNTNMSRTSCSILTGARMADENCHYEYHGTRQ